MCVFVLSVSAVCACVYDNRSGYTNYMSCPVGVNEWPNLVALVSLC